MLRVAVIALFAYCALLRVVGLDRLPGINGDEAWYGVQMQRALTGDLAFRTPLGNLLNPFLAVPVLLLTALFEPSFWILRVPALAAGAGAVAVSWLLLRRATDSVTGWILTLLLAAAPVDLVYSRLAWDPALIPLATGVFCYFLLKRSWIPALLALAAAVWIHPTAVFLTPLAIVHGAAAPPGGSNGRRRWARLGAGVLLAASGAALYLALVPAARAFSAADVVSRAVAPGQWLAFVRDLGRLFSGTTVYRFVVGPQTPGSVVAHDVAFWLVAVTAAGGTVTAWRAGRRETGSLAVATVAALAVFYLVTGSSAIQPGKERYALWCVVPVLLCLALGLRAWSTTPRRGVLVRVGVCAVAAAALVSFHVRFLHELEVTGGSAHRAFRTAVVEPKLAVLDLIREDAGSDDAWIVAEDWWLYWPIAYLAGNDPRVLVSIFPQGPEAGVLLHDALARRAYLVGFDGEEVDRALRSRNIADRILTVNDPTGAPILQVYRRGS